MSEHRQPTAAMLDAYQGGRAAQGSDVMAYAYSEPRFDEWMEHPVLRLCWHAGRGGHEVPRWVQAERYSDIPVGGASYNHADNHLERGLSVARLLDGSTDYEWHRHFGVRGRSVIRVAGWLHHECGSDGEPLLVGAVTLGSEAP
jgi:hypothetical protein